VPKERSHWLLAQRAASRLKPGLLADAALAYGEFVLSGAVAHDAGYYAGALGVEAGRRTADRLHGNDGWNTYAPFWALASRRDLGAPALAFGFGALTHLAADAVFHPLVYSWTGDAAALKEPWNRGWLYRHQALETALDRHFEALWGPAPASKLSSVVRAAGKDLPAVQSVFSGNDARPWLAAHSRLQGLFTVPPLFWLVRLATWNARGSDHDPTGVFYRSRAKTHPSFEGELRWIHPVTGHGDTATLEGLVERFDALISGLAEVWERGWTAGTAAPAGAGPHLDTGLASDGPQDKRWFTSPPWGYRQPR